MLRFGKALTRPFTAVAASYTTIAKAKPLMTAFVTSGLKTSAADMFAQKVIERREEVDWKRHFIFVTFGFCYLGGFQYYLYNVKFTQLCAPLTASFGHKAVSPLKTFLDQGIHHPFIYFPTFYTMKTAIEGKPLSVAWYKYKAEIWDGCKACWTVWVPAQLFNFAFVPRHFRVPFVALVSFAWTIIFSTMQGNFDKKNATLASDELREAQLAVVGTSFDAGQAGGPDLAQPPPIVKLEAPAVAALPLSLEVAAPPAAAASGKGGGSKAHTALEPRMWDLYCEARRQAQRL